MTPLDLAVLRHIVAFPGEDDVEAIAAAVCPLPRLETPPRTVAEWEARAAVVAKHWKGARLAVSASLRRLVRAGYVEKGGAPSLAPGVGARIEIAAADFRSSWRSYTRCLGWTRPPNARQAWLLGAERVVRDAVLYADASDEATGSTDFPTYAVLLWRVSKGPPSVKALLGRNPDGYTKRCWAGLCAAGLCRAPSQRWPTGAGVVLVSASVTPAGLRPVAAVVSGRGSAFGGGGLGVGA